MALKLAETKPLESNLFQYFTTTNTSPEAPEGLRS